MDINKSSESTITITVSVSVELRTILEEGTEAFAHQCRAALEEELNPILRIGVPRVAVASPPVMPIARKEDPDTEILQAQDTSNLTPPVAMADEARAANSDVQANNAPGSADIEAQMPPSQRRGRH